MQALLGHLGLLLAALTVFLFSRRWAAAGVLAAVLGPGVAALVVLLPRTWVGGSFFLAVQLTCWWFLLYLPAAWLVAARGRGRPWAVAYAVACAVFGFEAFVRGPRALEVTRTELPGPPLRIVLVADIQTDDVGAYEAEVFRQVREAEPDLVLFAGDYIQVEDNDSFVREAAELRALVATLRPRLGGYAVEGDVDADAWTTIFEGTAIRPLTQTTTVEVGGLTLTGLSIRDSRRLEVDLPRVSGTHLVVGHAPDYALGTARRDLNLAGHTHGGQVALPLFGPPLTLSKVPRAAAAGGRPFDLGEGDWLYVSRGVGMERLQAPRLRFLCPPELVVLDLGGPRPES